MKKGVVCAVLSTALVVVYAQNQTAKLTVAAVQFRSTFDIARNTQEIAGHLKRLAAQGVRVAVFPECALTGYRTDAAIEASAAAIERAEGTIASVCRESKIAAVVGSVYKVNGKAYNTAVVINSQGEVVERYGKVYLAGEKWATPGNHIAYFDLEGIPSTVIVCHDERYPELVRLPALQGARVVYYISSESGLKAEQKLAPYRAQVMARAVENGVFIVQANAPANPDLSGSHGQSRIVASDGNVLKEASFFGDDVVVETLEIRAGGLKRPLDELYGPWWREGVNQMMANRHRLLD